MRSVAILPLAFGLLTIGAGPGAANRIHTGGETGAYHRDFCPALTREMATMGQPYTCTPSTGTRENMQRVRSNPRELGFGQLDVFALDTRGPNGAGLQIVRQDDARECVFAVTRNREITSYGELSAYASTSRFFLPPLASGSVGTFQYLRTLDKYGLGRLSGNAITHAQGVDEAIRAALSRDDGVAFFVQYPDPDNERFKLVRDLGGHFVPVLDNTLLDQTVNGRAVYYAQDTRIANGRLSSERSDTSGRRTELGGRVTTACTPIVLFSAASARVSDSAERRLHSDMVTSVKDLPRDVVLPRQSPLRQAMEKTRELTAEGRQRFLAYSQRARDRALPFFQRMIERAAPRGAGFGLASSGRYDDRD
jgi:hypothetical protein